MDKRIIVDASVLRNLIKSADRSRSKAVRSTMGDAVEVLRRTLAEADSKGSLIDASLASIGFIVDRFRNSPDEEEKLRAIRSIKDVASNALEEQTEKDSPPRWSAWIKTAEEDLGIATRHAEETEGESLFLWLDTYMKDIEGALRVAKRVREACERVQEHTVSCSKCVGGHSPHCDDSVRLRHDEDVAKREMEEYISLLDEKRR